MAANKKGVTIVIKKIQGGGGAGHGGAWKVAFADFMTAMMCFFLVMWLMGADEEVKQEVAHYFNHPNTPYKSGRDPQSNTVNPLGEKVGDGESVMKGAEGAVPEDMVQTPLRDVKDLVEQKLSDIAFGVELDAEIDVMKFSLLGDEVFEEGTTEIKKSVMPKLEQIGKLFQTYPGYILVEGHLDKKKSLTGEDPYLFSTARALAIMNFFTKPQKGREPAAVMDENRFCPRGVGSRRTWSVNGGDTTRNRRVEFTLSQKNPCTE
jgi:chemotaxis protein MotB